MVSSEILAGKSLCDKPARVRPLFSRCAASKSPLISMLRLSTTSPMFDANLTYFEPYFALPKDVSSVLTVLCAVDASEEWSHVLSSK